MIVLGMAGEIKFSFRRGARLSENQAEIGKLLFNNERHNKYIFTILYLTLVLITSVLD